MAKTQIKNYVFKPGIGANGNLHPNAYSLLNANKEFIQKEASAYITSKISLAQQYTPTGATYAPATGVLEVTIGTHNFNVGDALLIAQAGITFRCALDGNATLHPYPRVTDPAYQKALTITAKTATSVTVNVGISSDTSVHTFESATANAISDVFFNYTNDSEAKCERDVGYVIDAYLNDLRYGGNEKLYNTIKYYWDQTVAQVDGDRGAEIATHNFIGRLIKDYIFTKTTYTALNTEITQTVTGDNSEALQQFTPTGATYKPATGDMSITIGTHSLAVGDEIHIAPGGITFTCALDGGATLHPYPRASGVPNAKGKDPYYYAPITITAVTSTTITANVGISSDTSVHTFSSATANSVTAGPNAKINTLAFNTVDVIANGLNALPKLVSTGVSTIKVQGKYSVNELLLISNSTRSEIVYNFTNATSGATVEISDNQVILDSDFPKYLETTDGITTIKLNYDTSAHLASDDIQIFVEEREVRTRPFDFGTDAIERPRAAMPVSMLDADFEYGLQPTKWAAIAAMRGYPSVYEIPGTDTQVTSVVTDASAGTEGVGQSKITVTTVTPHGFKVGTPVTIKALEDSVNGAARAEGSFVIVNVPSDNTFEFYAKSKVGTVNPTTLSTTYTQLREAGFYTGASIGTPNFVIASNGSAGSMNTQLGVLSGSNIIPFDGTAPEIGSPLTNPNIPLGSQVTGIIDNSAGGGTYVTPLTASNTAAGQNQMEFQSISGVVENLAIDRGDGNAIYINNIDGNTATFDGNFTATIVGNRNAYTGILPDNDPNIGSLAKFDISHSSDSSFTYVLTAIENDGINYKVGDRITIPGTDLGGASPANDATIIVDSVGSDNSIATASIAGLYFNNDVYLADQTATFTGGLGTEAQFDITFANGVYSSVAVVSTEKGSGYKIGDVLKITADTLVPGYSGPERSAFISVDAVGTLAGVSTSVSLVAAGTGYTTGTTVNTTGGTGTGLTLTITTDVTNTDEVASAVIAAAGSGYTAFDVVTLAAGNSDSTFRVDTVSALGSIETITFAGSAPSINKTYTSVAYTTTSAGGTGAIIDVQVTGDSYQVTFTNAGNNYLPTETITVAGTTLGGTTPANDLTITIDNVGGSGDITVTTDVGTTFNGDTLSGLPGDNVTPTGATFNVDQNQDGTLNATISDSGDGGYNVGQVHTVSGTLFGGTSPTNDLSITIDAISDLEDGEVTTISTSGSGYVPLGTYIDVIGTNNLSNGTGAEFSLIRDAGNYSNFVVTTPGTGYEVGNRLEIDAPLVDGVAPLNDILINVTSVNETGGVQTFTTESIEAAIGTSADLISTVTMTEVTTGAMALDEEITFSALATIEATFTNAHGLVPGSTFITSVSSDDGSNNHELAAGSYIATDIPELNKLRFQVRAPGSIDVAGTDIQGEVYPRPDSFFIHRPYDGGVQLGTGGPQHGSQAIRQSKKYIRYQSGKGIMYTTGALFAPSYDLRSLTAEDVEVGSLITVVTDDNDHGVQEDGIIRILGVETPGYNSGPETAVPPTFDYVVEEVVDERTFKIRAQRRLGATEAILGFGSQMSVVAWHGATVRSGIFDDQNGIFWEFDGTNISVNQRTGTRQLAGTIALQVDNNLITGVNTRFTDQLKAGDRIIIKGMTHVVSHVNSQTQITVTPDWRGVVDISGAKANLIVDKKTKQKDFNLDRLDGTGPSGYDIDIAKMQMIGIQYSWYGAGFIDFMLRGSDGNFVFAHRMRNSNVNTEAFMRSGNLPVRYEVTNEGPSGKLTAAMDSTQTTVPLVDSSFFPDKGTLYIDNEIITFNGNNQDTNTLTGAVRGASFINFQAGATRTYTAGLAATHNDRTGVVLISQSITPLISHWGSAFITDGGFDEDRGYIFSYAETALTVSTTKQTAFMIRLAPSVSNALIGDLGERELLNRAQLLLQGIEVTSESGSGGIVIEGILNPQNYPLNPDDVGWSGLSGVAQGGQPSFAEVAAGGSVVWSTGAAATTTTATASGTISGTINSNPSRNWGRNNYIPIDAADYRAVFGSNNTSLVIGKRITGTNIPGNTTIIDARVDSNGNYGWFRLSNRTSNGIPQGTVDAFTVLLNPDSLSDRNFAYFTTASFESSGAKVGTAATSGGGVTFPANSQVNSVELKEFGGTQYYEVQFNNNYSGTLANGSGTVEFTFEQPPYAQPGETVFSFIATPGERSTLSLAELKELTNTPLGGRGTFPNGPDVLAINVYKVSGADINSNIILRWGEAQA